MLRQKVSKHIKDSSPCWLQNSFEATLGLATGGFDGAAADGFARASPGAIVHALLMFVKMVYLPGDRCGGGPGGQSGQRRFELADDFDGGLVLQLSDQRLEPRFQLRLVLAKQRPPHRRQMLHGVIKVQPLAGLLKAIIGQPPDPCGPVGNDQRAGGLTQAAPQGFGVELFTQRVNTLAGDRGAPQSSLGSPLARHRIGGSVKKRLGPGHLGNVH